MFTLMLDTLSPLARFLTHRPIGKAGKVAAPTFGYFEYESHHELCQLKGAIWLAIIAYVGDTRAQAELIVVQDAINKLVDINNV
jgi:hypothetical protein